MGVLSMSEKTKCLDTMGHKLSEGDWISILPPPNTIWIGRIAEISEGGVSLSIDKNNRGVTLSKIRVVLDISLNANPQMPVFPNLVKVFSPGSDELENKMTEIAETPPPSGSVQ